MPMLRSRITFRSGRLVLLAATLVVITAAPACTTSPRQPSQSGSTARSEQSLPGSAHDLSQDEAAGGHVLKKHVGRTDDQLRERLQREGHISAASTYTDRGAAEHAVGAAIEQSRPKIDRWLARDSGHPNLVLDYDADRPIGRTLRRGDDQSQPCSHALVVLKWFPPGDYYVLTSYPECR